MTEWLMTFSWVPWVVLAVACLIVEALTTSLVSIWFVAGAIVAAVVSLFTDNAWIQIGVFLVCSGLMLLAFKKFFRKPHRESLKEGDQLLIGRVGVAHTDITEWEGTVRIGDVYWRAVSKTPVPQGARVRVIAANGTQIEVEAMTEKESVQV